MSTIRTRQILSLAAVAAALSVGSLAVAALSPFGSAGADTGSPEAQPFGEPEAQATASPDPEAGKSVDSRKGLNRYSDNPERLAPLADVLNMTPEAIAEALDRGRTVAELAGERTDEAIDALVGHWMALLQAKGDDGPVAGKVNENRLHDDPWPPRSGADNESLSSDQADAGDPASNLRAYLKRKATAFVNGELPEHGDEKPGSGTTRSSADRTAS